MASRLSRNIEKKSEKRLILSIVGIIAVLFLLVRYGVPSLIGFSDFLANTKGSQDTTKSNSIVGVPIFTTSFTATNSAAISLDGNAAPKEKINLYVNDNLTDSVDTKDDGTFSFKNVSLKLGNNDLKAKAIKNKDESEFSDTLSIQYKTSQPGLLIEEPSDGQNFPKETTSVNVKGKTDPGVKVTINDFWALDDQDGNYSYNLTLQSGDNQIKVVAVDDAGNKTEKDIKVTKSQ
jgi:bacillopeptidase F